MIIALAVCISIAETAYATLAAFWQLWEGVRNHNHPSTWYCFAMEAAIGAFLLSAQVALAVLMSRKHWRSPARYRIESPQCKPAC